MTPQPDNSPLPTALKQGRPTFGVVIIGDEILSGKRADKHLPKMIELLGARSPAGVGRAWGTTLIASRGVLQRAFASGDVVFSLWWHRRHAGRPYPPVRSAGLGAGASPAPPGRGPDPERMQDMAREQGVPYEPARADNVHHG